MTKFRVSDKFIVHKLYFKDGENVGRFNLRVQKVSKSKEFKKFKWFKKFKLNC